MIGGKRFAVVRQDLLRFAVAGKRLVECGVCVGAVFGQRERFGADIESAGVVDDLVDGDLGVGNVEQALDHRVDLPQLAHIITGETLVRAARTFASIGVDQPGFIQPRCTRWS